jgi:N-carbamoyl-L-amino-acid hydrolase
MTERTRTLVVVDWADEEGTRFGRSLLGSAAATGELTAAEFALLRTPAGEPAAAITEPYGFHADALGTPSARLGRVVAALELHIEQGPVLERSGRSVATVDGALGVRRFRLRFDGDTGHAGATPMDQRRDPVRTASDWVTQVMGLAESCGGLATVGQFTVEPSLPTVIARTAELSLDLRHRDLKSLDELAAAALSAAGDAAVEPLFSSDPTRFDQALVERALDLTQGPPLTSGPLHDSVSLARAGIPTVMMFAPSIGGISHARAEDTADADLRAAMTTFAALAASLLAGD